MKKLLTLAALVIAVPIASAQSDEPPRDVTCAPDPLSEYIDCRDRVRLGKGHATWYRTEGEFVKVVVQTKRRGHFARPLFVYNGIPDLPLRGFTEARGIRLSAGEGTLAVEILPHKKRRVVDVYLVRAH